MSANTRSRSASHQTQTTAVSRRKDPPQWRIKRVEINFTKVERTTSENKQSL